MKNLTLFLVSFLVLASCTRESGYIDLLTNNTCDVPCVLGITPGVTTYSDARKIVDSNSSLSDCMEYDHRNQGGVHWIDCNAKSFGLVFLDDLVVTITIASPNLTVDGLIQEYGSPDAIFVLDASRPDDPSRSKAIFRYDRIQMWVTLIEKPGTAYVVTPDTQVEAIVFERKDEYEMMATTISDTWMGYGAYYEGILP